MYAIPPLLFHYSLPLSHVTSYTPDSHRTRLTHSDIESGLDKQSKDEYADNLPCSVHKVQEHLSSRMIEMSIMSVTIWLLDSHIMFSHMHGHGNLEAECDSTA